MCGTGRYTNIEKDGAGPISAIIDPTASGKFSEGVDAEVAERTYLFPFDDLF